jgi:hypothetical protein
LMVLRSRFNSDRAGQKTRALAHARTRRAWIEGPPWNVSGLTSA